MAEMRMEKEDVTMGTSTTAAQARLQHQILLPVLALEQERALPVSLAIPSSRTTTFVQKFTVLSL